MTTPKKKTAPKAQTPPPVIWLNVGSGTHNAAAPWVNVDAVSRPDDGVVPDVIAQANALPYPDNSAERLCASHVLEHVRWRDLPQLLAEFQRVLKPGGELLAIGPDCHRMLTRWKDGLEPWDLVLAALEHDDRYDGDEWDEASHKWNAHEARLINVLTRTGFVDVVPYDVTGTDWAAMQWPVVGAAGWQCAVICKAPQL